ncbi:ABC-type multidrug transport system, ATPase component [Lactobacillus taiwanensis DSM 21401]|uniref:Lantibiotic ABC transporter ATP-binding protein n=1 Tax=Lactobacillus taiwanensis TaxID=508451 RepID=A0A256LGF1_9LACO|nr:ABC transporter ATP-binding protein [Lactobacillus taiwanensis]KRM98690.1 ABC-type multidrug transport system, ATPase component [Lactobacillus taiwanensis DSM 21401]OYR88613.1 lantibiotic ABC transporter ATP-binding protein [Lactobacillus taiwanensis]OYR91209.1 lantibiotic ABC transporter ATP-binding protein [Lactobacillus taiwanensis]OYR92420.1 lantibiotic ABC transporter ATP-binding protein [Lactobacillus taiwanensis]OYR95811.1 lantibiotic ABC transporter ATP-binding protein [Lactobacillu
MTDILTTKELGKNFKNKHVLSRINIHVPEGKIYCIMGPNGAGKSTLLKMISGIEKPTEGVINFKGENWKREDLKVIGSLIEEPGLFYNLTVEDNIKLKLKLHHVENKDQEQILNTLGFGDHNQEKVKGFSTGMRQRLGIALAFMGNPDLVVLDEPTNGLDTFGIHELRELLMLEKKQGKTIIIASHRLSEIQKVADRIAILGNGELLLEEDYDQKTDLEDLFISTLEKAGVKHD